MKHVNIFTQAAGLDIIRSSWEMFQKLGVPDNTLMAAYAGADAKPT